MIDLTLNQTDPFKKFVQVSALAHSLLLLLWAGQGLLFPTNVIEIPNAIRVDIVDLPDKPTDTPASQKPPAPKPQIKPKTEVAPKPKPKPSPKSQQDMALEKIHQLKALDKIQSSESTETQNHELKASTPQYKGNRLTSGNSFNGLSGIAAQEYWSDVKVHIQNHWALPEWLADAPLKASVVVRIDVDGHVQKYEIYKSSGNQSFDDAALSAIESASPFPVPPDRIKDTISNNWMIFNFPE